MCTHIVPIIDGKQMHELTKRIPIGGNHQTDYLMKSLILKYPQHRQGLGVEQILEIQHNHTYCALNYENQIKYLENLYDKERNEIKQHESLRNDKYLGKFKIEQLREDIKVAENENHCPNKR